MSESETSESIAFNMSLVVGAVMLALSRRRGAHVCREFHRSFVTYDLEAISMQRAPSVHAG